MSFLIFRSIHLRALLSVCYCLLIGVSAFHHHSIDVFGSAEEYMHGYGDPMHQSERHNDIDCSLHSFNSQDHLTLSSVEVPGELYASEKTAILYRSSDLFSSQHLRSLRLRAPPLC